MAAPSRQPPTRSSRPFWGCGGCALAFLLACSFAVFAALWIVAKVGVLRVPLLSEAVYHPSGPVREVRQLSGYSPTDILATLAARAQRNPASGQISTVISEEELTTIVAKGLRDAEQQGGVALSDVQVAISADWLEFSATTSSDGKNVPVVVRATPTVRDHALSVVIDRLAFGALDVPRFVTSAVVATFGDAALRSLNAALAGVGTLQRISLQEGKMEVFLSPH